MNPFEMSDDEGEDVIVISDTQCDDHRERTESRETTSFYDTMDDNDSKYYSTHSNM